MNRLAIQGVFTLRVLSPTLAEKVISVNERGLTSADWVVYNNGTKRTRYSSVPTSDITAETVVVDGLISSAGFIHGGSEKQFGYSYLPGSHLLQTLTMPCNMTLTQSYESQRDLIIGMAYLRGNTLVTQRSYTYDTLGRPLTRSTARNGQTVNDSFVHNSRSELTGATVNGCTYGYAYDNIGNRNTATEGEEVTAYTANNLNQYTSIQENEETAFVPTFDTDGNQTLVKTATGLWSVQYNAENRPVRFTSTDGSTVIECSYDTLGRRATKKVTTNGSITLHQRYIYRGYLQLASCDLTRTGHPCLWLLTWDPTQPIATRPLAIRKDGTWYAYGWDLTKNICEVFGQHGYLRTAYSYSPYGEVTADGDVTQPIQWSSEYHDTELGLIYYNYRHYNPVDGRWLRREPLSEREEWNVYIYVQNKPINHFDVTGLFIDTVWDVGNMLWDVGEIVVGAVTGNTEMMETGAVNFAFDTAAAVIPGVPAGVSKMVKTTTKKGVKQGVKRTPKKKQKEKKKKKDETPDGCKPCIPRAGTLMHQIALPGSRVRGAHKCDMVGHVKVWKMNQAPYPKCTCHWGKPKTYENTQTPPEDSISGGPPTSSQGGGGGPATL